MLCAPLMSGWPGPADSSSAQIPALQAAGIGRADQNQQNVPGPPSQQKNGGAVGDGGPGMAHGELIPEEGSASGFDIV
jgi:hypothetical protein